MNALLSPTLSSTKSVEERGRLNWRLAIRWREQLLRWAAPGSSNQHYPQAGVLERRYRAITLCGHLAGEFTAIDACCHILCFNITNRFDFGTACKIIGCDESNGIVINGDANRFETSVGIFRTNKCALFFRIVFVPVNRANACQDALRYARFLLCDKDNRVNQRLRVKV